MATGVYCGKSSTKPAHWGSEPSIAQSRDRKGSSRSTSAATVLVCTLDCVYVYADVSLMEILRVSNSTPDMHSFRVNTMSAQ